MAEHRARRAGYEHIQVAPVTNAIGAEIHGVDLATTLGSVVVDEIGRAFLEHHVIVFRDQTLTPERQKAFGANFGSFAIQRISPRCREEARGQQDHPASRSAHPS